jgi:hypothetical protein
MQLCMTSQGHCGNRRSALFLQLVKRKMISKLSFVVSALLAGASTAQDGGELSCFKGFVMDTFCIERGTLLDKPSVESLRNPELHSYHCLVDVKRCVDSGFEMLADVRNETGGLYGRFLRLDEAGNQMVIDLARANGKLGSCSTCTGVSGSEEEGFRATVVGTIVPGSAPRLFNTESVLPYDEACPEESSEIDPVGGDISIEAGTLSSPIRIHGSLMLVSWGFLLPLGVITARFFRHRPNALWFKMHRALQIVGLCIALAGWSIALKNFSVLGSGGGTGSSEDKKAYAHACCGTTAMCLGLLQPLNALFRPHSPAEGGEKAKPRFLWEILHKSMGYIATVLALVTIGLGTRIAAEYENQFLAGFIAALVVLVVVAFVMVVDKILYKKKEGTIKTEDFSADSSKSHSEPRDEQPEVSVEEGMPVEPIEAGKP